MRLIALGDRDPQYLTHREIDAALALLPEDVEGSWMSTDALPAVELDAVDGVWLLPGGPYRDDEAAFAAIEYCRTTGTPFLGTCSGFQYACVQLCRALAGVEGAAHAEADPDAQELVIVPLGCSLYGERRTVTPVPGTRLSSICGEQPFEGFHFCGYGLADELVPVLEQVGVGVSAFAPDAGAEAIELPDHPFFLATAFQPQVGSSESRRLHPLLLAFVEAAREHSSAPSRLG